MSKYAFGVDVGGTSVKLGLFDESCSALDKWEIPTDKSDNGTKILPDVAASILQVMSQMNMEKEAVIGVGVGAPGPVDDTGVIERALNLGWGVFNLSETLEKLLDLPVKSGNDANVAAFGEMWQGGGKGYDSAVMFTLGTGVGSGVIVDGKIVAGKNGGAGELGHITVEPTETVQCNCGKYGCLEQYASANGIVRLAKVMLEGCDTPSALRTMDKFTSKDICDLARDGEEMALAIVDRFGEYLGRALSFVSCTVDPDVFIIGGGMSRAGDIIVEPIMKYYRKYAFHVSTGTTASIATLGNDAGIYGCAKMVIG